LFIEKANNFAINFSYVKVTVKIFISECFRPKEFFIIGFLLPTPLPRDNQATFKSSCHLLLFV